MVLQRPVEMQVARRTGDQAGVRESGEGVRDRRPLRARELPQHPMRQWQCDADTGRVDPAPAGGKVPEEQHEADLQPRLARDRAQRIDVGDPSAGATQKDLGDLRPRPHTVRKLRIEHRKPR